MKRIFLIFLLLNFWLSGFSQTDTIQTKPDAGTKKDTQVRSVQAPALANPKPISASPRKDSLNKKDTQVNGKTAPVLPKQPPSQPIRQPAEQVANLEARDSVTSVQTDSILLNASTPADSAKVIEPKPIPVFSGIDSSYARFLNNPYLPMDKKPVYQIVKIRNPVSKDDLFYMIVGLVCFLACIKWLFNRYYTSIFRFFFQPSFKQKQTREQLMQSSLPSLLLNIFFILSAGTYVSLLIRYFGLLSVSFLERLLYSTSALLLLYAGKYVFISFSGWVFNAKDAAGTYIFAVYLINKILGVLLLPFIFILAFSKLAIIEVSITISFILVILLFIYRYIVSYGPVRKEVKVSPLHFFVYVLAFEVLPLLFIYKLLILYMNRTL